MNERRVTLVKMLAVTLRLAERSDIEDLALTYDNKAVIIHYGSGAKKTVYVEGDSDLGILYEVLKKVLY